MPLVDDANGGSMLHFSETLMKAHAGIKNVDTIINGHMPAQTTWADLKEYADFNKDLVAWMQAELKAGKTPNRRPPNGRCRRSTKATRRRSAPSWAAWSGVSRPCKRK